MVSSLAHSWRVTRYCVIEYFNILKHCYACTAKETFLQAPASELLDNIEEMCPSY